ncbi:hypothetical protein FQN55_009286 [Onygenales sp. PD_40]|nr:hypothetical protein FQN55_009286 [Onygenales sp. PD_40]
MASPIPCVEVAERATELEEDTSEDDVVDNLLEDAWEVHPESTEDSEGGSWLIDPLVRGRDRSHPGHEDANCDGADAPVQHRMGCLEFSAFDEREGEFTKLAAHLVPSTGALVHKPGFY